MEPLTDLSYHLGRQLVDVVGPGGGAGAGGDTETGALLLELPSAVDRHLIVGDARRQTLGYEHLTPRDGAG